MTEDLESKGDHLPGGWARRGGLARRLILLRFRTLRLSREAFCRRYGLSVGSVKDCEQERGTPSRAGRTLIEAIALNPELVEQAARNAERWGGE